jgi:ribosomal subunit interface protein
MKATKQKEEIVMNIKITGKDVKATDAIKDYIEKKLTRLEKYYENEEINATAVIKVERELQIAELATTYRGQGVRAVAESKDLYASIDEDIDILERQIRKTKTRKERMNKDESLRVKEELISSYSEFEKNDLSIPDVNKNITIWNNIDQAYINYMRTIGIYE